MIKNTTLLLMIHAKDKKIGLIKKSNNDVNHRVNLLEKQIILTTAKKSDERYFFFFL